VQRRGERQVLAVTVMHAVQPIDEELLILITDYAYSKNKMESQLCP